MTDVDRQYTRRNAALPMEATALKGKSKTNPSTTQRL